MCSTRYCDTLNPLTNTSPLNSPSPNTSLSPPFLHSYSLILFPLPSPQLTTLHPNLLPSAALINARSLRNKIPTLISLMTDHDLDILFITETWLSPLDFPHIAAPNTPPTASFTTLATLSIPMAAPEYLTNLL